uniref:Uncharacterized protein n=1 Tax=Wuchereria bancrofti TaxID=6293 RepID=A0AAF5PHV7_WUCBA
MNEHSSTYLPSNVLDAIRNIYPISTVVCLISYIVTPVGETYL